MAFHFLDQVRIVSTGEVGIVEHVDPAGWCLVACVNDDPWDQRWHTLEEIEPVDHTDPPREVRSGSERVAGEVELRS